MDQEMIAMKLFGAVDVFARFVHESAHDEAEVAGNLRPPVEDAPFVELDSRRQRAGMERPTHSPARDVKLLFISLPHGAFPNRHGLDAKRIASFPTRAASQDSAK
jgi:hypothetical protein